MINVACQSLSNCCPFSICPLPLYFWLFLSISIFPSSLSSSLCLILPIFSTYLAIPSFTASIRWEFEEFEERREKKARTQRRVREWGISFIQLSLCLFCCTSSLCLFIPRFALFASSSHDQEHNVEPSHQEHPRPLPIPSLPAGWWFVACPNAYFLVNQES